MFSNDILDQKDPTIFASITSSYDRQRFLTSCLNYSTFTDGQAVVGVENVGAVVEAVGWAAEPSDELGLGRRRLREGLRFYCNKSSSSLPQPSCQSVQCFSKLYRQSVKSRWSEKDKTEWRTKIHYYESNTASLNQGILYFEHAFSNLEDPPWYQEPKFKKDHQTISAFIASRLPRRQGPRLLPNGPGLIEDI